MLQKIEWLNDIGKTDFKTNQNKILQPEFQEFLEIGKKEIVKATHNLALNEFTEITDFPSQFSITKTNNYDRVKNDFITWGKEQLIKDCFVYVFWKNSKEAVYIGRSTQGIKRPADHLTRYWINHVRSVEIYPLLNKRNLAKAECLATHIFPSERNITKPGTIIYTSKCPVCSQIKYFNAEMRKLLK